MVRAIIGVIVGLLVGSAVNMGIVVFSWTLYPAPEGIDPWSSDPAMQEKAMAWIGTLPAGAFLWAWVAHWAGALAGAAVAILIHGRRSYVPGLIVGGLFTLGGIANLFMIPCPVWFPFLDLPSYLLVAWLAGKWLVRDRPATA